MDTPKFSRTNSQASARQPSNPGRGQVLDDGSGRPATYWDDGQLVVYDKDRKQVDRPGRTNVGRTPPSQPQNNKGAIDARGSGSAGMQDLALQSARLASAPPVRGTRDPGTAPEGSTTGAASLQGRTPAGLTPADKLNTDINVKSPFLSLRSDSTPSTNGPTLPPASPSRTQSATPAPSFTFNGTPVTRTGAGFTTTANPQGGTRSVGFTPSVDQAMEVSHPGWSKMSPDQRAAVFRSAPQADRGVTTSAPQQVNAATGMPLDVDPVTGQHWQDLPQSGRTTAPLTNGIAVFNGGDSSKVGSWGTATNGLGRNARPGEAVPTSGAIIDNGRDVTADYAPGGKYSTAPAPTFAGRPSQQTAPTPTVPTPTPTPASSAVATAAATPAQVAPAPPSVTSPTSSQAGTQSATHDRVATPASLVRPWNPASVDITPKPTLDLTGNPIPGVEQPTFGGVPGGVPVAPVPRFSPKGYDSSQMDPLKAIIPEKQGVNFGSSPNPNGQTSDIDSSPGTMLGQIWGGAPVPSKSEQIAGVYVGKPSQEGPSQPLVAPGAPGYEKQYMAQNSIALPTFDGGKTPQVTPASPTGSGAASPTFAGQMPTDGRSMAKANDLDEEDEKNKSRSPFSL